MPGTPVKRARREAGLVPRHVVKRRKKKYKAFAEVVALADSLGVPYSERPAGIPSAEVLEWVLQRAFSMLQWAAFETDKIRIAERGVSIHGDKLPDTFWRRKVDAQGNVLVEPHYAFKLEAELRKEVLEIAKTMEALDIAGRRVAIEEAQTEALGLGLKRACEAVGMSPDAQRAFGAALREALTGVIDGEAVIEGIETGEPGSAEEVAA